MQPPRVRGRVDDNTIRREDQEVCTFVRCVHAYLPDFWRRFRCAPQNGHKACVTFQIDLQPVRVGDLPWRTAASAARGDEGQATGGRRASG
jgi:hypothetical protein